MKFMCYNCGCQNPDDDMGHSDNITTQTLKHLSEHWGKSLEETKRLVLKALETEDKILQEDHHLKEMFEKAAKAWGQSADQAKENAQALLKKELQRN